MRGWHVAGESTAALAMDGPEIYNFTLKAVPALVQQVCERAGITQGDVDYFVFHQANAFMLESLRRKIGISPDRFEVSMRNFGNTVSSTIPIALREAERAGRIRPGMRILLAGFGVGLSWGGCIFNYQKLLTTYE